MDTLFCKVSGKGKPLVFLHGLGASHRMWSTIINHLPQTYQFVTPDLLGFGRSPKPDSTYTTKQHITAIEESIKENKIEQPFTLIGNSLGSILTIAYTKHFPKDVDKLIIIAPPIYKTSQEAKAKIISSPRVEYLLYSPLGRIYCGIHQLFHGFFSLVLPLLIKKYPKTVIQDFLLHTWQSYKYTVTHVIEEQDAFETLLHIKIPTLILYSDNDRLMNIQTLEKLAEKNKQITLKKLSGQHDFPLVYPKEVSEEITRFLER